jgi:hydrogenase/urease accessory protein HupE
VKRLAFLLPVFLLLCRVALAHPFQVEPVIIELRPQETFLNAEIQGNVQDIEQIPGYTQSLLDNSTMSSRARSGNGYSAEFQKAVERYWNDRFALKQGDKTLVAELKDLRHEPGEDITKARFKLVIRYPGVERDKPLEIHNTLFDYLPNAKIIVQLGAFTRTLAPNETVAIDPKNLISNLLTNIWSFLVLGCEHIFTGPDHILFILALLMVASSLPNLIKTLTGFTIAHSITLVWVTLSGQGPDQRIVDILVAFSIIYVGAENLFMRVDYESKTPAATEAPAMQRPRFALTPKHRFWVASGFGLIHGFAFAQNLRDAGLPEGAALGWSLFSFNLGVEIAQVILAAIAYPLLMRWRKNVEKRQKFGGMSWGSMVKVTSLGIVIAGGYWLAQRLFGG